jgi:KaiC/GvpD/RAD55 family RecA-like ATPase
MSFSFTESKNSKPFVKIINGKYNNKTIFIDTNLNEIDNVNNFKGMRIPNNSNFQLVPDTSHERDVMMVVGPSGSGKSYFVKKYCEQYIKKFKDRNIYVFSNLKEDSSLDTLKNKIKRFKLDSSLYEDPIDVADLKESCVIFDDTDCIADKKIRQAVITLLDQCLEVGRHWKITTLITFHLASDKHTTRKMLNECMYYVFFPHSFTKSVKYVLQNYFDIDDKTIKHFKRLNSRWVCIRKNFPMCWASEHEISLLNIDSDDEK